MKSDRVRMRVVVTGRVQGVSFRASTAEEAERIGNLTGFVRNLPDGSVEIDVQGSRADVAALVSWAGHGPRAARVDGMKKDELPLDETLEPFTIR